MNGQSIRVGAAILGFCGLLVLAGCGAGKPKVSRPACPAGQICLEYGNTIDPATLDPQKASLVNEATIIRAAFEGLYQDDVNGKAVLGVASDAQVSPDGLTWTFKLRPSQWSDGQPLTARDFVFAYRRILDPATASDYAYLLYILENGQAINGGHAKLETLGAEAPDDHTLVLRLVHPAPYLPQLLKHQSFYPVPEHAVRRWGSAWTAPEHFVSNGAYVITAFHLGDYIRAEKNPLYYDAAKVCVDRINFLPINDAVTAERRVKGGEIDINDTISSSRVAYLRKLPAMKDYVRTHTYLQAAYVIFNTHVPALANRDVRQALSMTVDRDFITAKLLRAGQTPAYSFVPPGMSGYVPDDQRPKPYWRPLTFQQRQAEARRLLVRAGYGPGHPLKFEIKTANNTDSVLLSQAIQADWQAIGVDAGLRQEEGQIAFQDFNVKDFQVGLVSWILDYDDPMTFLGLMKSDTGAQNYGDFKNPQYDALLHQADNEPDGAKRALILAKAEQLVVDDADIAPVYYGVNRNLVRPGITGWVDNFADVHSAKYLCAPRTGILPANRAAATSRHVGAITP